MTHGIRRVQDYMTWVPHTVDVAESVAGAWQRMHTLGVEHLPVVEEEQLVGMLTLRELDAIWSSEARDPFKIPVGDVMRKNPQSVPPAAPISDVVRVMRAGPDDCCAVVEEGHLLGIVTTRDALRLLDELLARPELASLPSLRPSEVRARILAEHELLRAMFARAGDLLRDAADEPSDAADAALYEHCRELYLTVLHHIELENAILAPALREADGFGEVRAAQLLSEHERQRKSFLLALASLDTRPLVETASAIAELIENLRSDMAHEERALLDPDLLKDDCIDAGSCEG